MSEAIREAVVIDNIDPSHRGKIKIRIMPEMADFSEDLLPWVGIYKQGTGFSGDTGVHELPENGTLIRVLIEDWPFLKKIRYVSDDYVEGLYFYSKTSGLTSITELGTQTYPQPIFKIYKDGTIDFHNSDTGEHGTLYKNGGYYMVQSNGQVNLNTVNRDVRIYNSSGYIALRANGDIELNGSTKNLVTHAELNTALQTFINALNLHTHPTAASGPPSTPTLPMSLDISTSITNKVKTL
jgi:hypothetical protein